MAAKKKQEVKGEGKLLLADKDIPDADQNEPAMKTEELTSSVPATDSVEEIKVAKKPKGKAQNKLQKDVIILRAAVKYLASTKTPEEYRTFASLFPELME
jgi:hypothetical protein